MTLPIISKENKYKSQFNTKFFRTGFTPVLEKIETESGLEQKLGGKIPFFSKKTGGWPKTSSGALLAFVAQFVDPREDIPKTWLQVWVENIEKCEEDPYVVVKKIPVENIIHKNYIKNLYLNDKELPNQGLNYDQAQEITSWIKYEDINIYHPEFNEQLSCSQYMITIPSTIVGKPYEVLNTELFETEALVSLKIEGIGESVQSISYDFFIQNLYLRKWGDCGTLHIDYDCEFATGDMC